MTSSAWDCAQCGRALCRDCADWAGLRVRCGDCAARSRRRRRRWSAFKPALWFAAAFTLGALATMPLSETPREACHRFWGKALAHDWCDDPPTGLVCVSTPEGGIRGAGCALGMRPVSSDE